MATTACGADALVQNSTSFPVRASARLRSLFADYQRLREPGAEPSEEARAAAALRYYQFLVRAVLANPEFGTGECGNARGLLIYHTMGMGKTLLAAAAAMALWDVRSPLVLVAKSLQANFRQAVEKFVELTAGDLAADALAARQAAAVRRFKFASLDAYNMATQVARATSGVEGSGTLNSRLLIVDEAHNLFRGIINSPSEATNARRLYAMVMGARNLRILFLTGTVPSKDPFELVPCFNMLAGYDLLPTQYEAFYQHYVDRAGARVKNRGKLANRLLGLVSHATHTLPSDPDQAARPRGGPELRAAGGFPELLDTIVERVEMSAEQFRQYLLAREKEEAEGGGGEGGRAPPADRIAASPPLSLPGSGAGAGSTYYVRSRTLGNFAPPLGQRGRPVSQMPDSAFDGETSPKATRLLANIAKAEGPVLIYSQFVAAGGLAMLARFLRNAGYSEYALPELAGGGGGAPAEAGEMGWKFAIISGDVKPADRTRIQAAFNSPANAHGGVIRALLISKTGAEGLNLKWVREVHILEPYWDKSREDQVVARGVRLGSHDDLPTAEREVRPFLYLAVANREALEGMRPTQTEEAAPPRRSAALEEQTIDEKFHEKALGKHALNLAFRRLLRDVSLECAINGYGGCRLCVPTDAPLFHEDPVQDLRLPDPCQPLVEAEVSVQEIRLDDAVYFYREEPSAAFGVRFFEYDAELEAHSPVDPSSGLFMRLLEKLRGRREL